jgi:hypothetical protein
MFSQNKLEYDLSSCFKTKKNNGILTRLKNKMNLFAFKGML